MAAALGSVAAAQERDWSGQHPIHYPDPDIDRARSPVSASTSSRNTPSSAFTPERSGPKARPGTASDGISSGATFPTTSRCAVSKRIGHVTVFRNPSGYSNGNTFDFEAASFPASTAAAAWCDMNPTGRHRDRRKFQGKRLNSPNDIVVHPDGGIWFTDPTYGINGNYEGFQSRAGESNEAVYRVDPRPGKSTR